MSTTDLIIWLSAGLLILAVVITAAFTLAELRRPPLKGRLDDIIAAAASRKRGTSP